MLHFSMMNGGGKLASDSGAGQLSLLLAANFGDQFRPNLDPFPGLQHHNYY